MIGGLCPRLVCDGEFSGAGVSGPVLACFVSDEGFVGLEWSAPNVSHEKSSSINQVSVVLWHSLLTASPHCKAKSTRRRTSWCGCSSCIAEKLAIIQSSTGSSASRALEWCMSKQSAPTLATCSVNLLCVLGVYCVSYHVQSPSSLQSKRSPSKPSECPQDD